MERSKRISCPIDTCEIKNHSSLQNILTFEHTRKRTVLNFNQSIEADPKMI